jgi:hyperosmotically inducible periplasmic protein
VKSTLAIPLLLAGTLLLPAASYAADGQQTPDQRASMAPDMSIAARIRSEMAAQNIMSLPYINIETDSAGAVVLSGTAGSQGDIDKTMSIARGTTGVTSVTNDIKVKRGE